MTATGQNVEVIRLKRLMKKLGGVSKATVYRMMDEGKIPRNFKIGQRASGWIESEIDAAILALRGVA